MQSSLRGSTFWLCMLIALGLLIGTPAYAKKKDKSKGQDESSEVEGGRKVPPGLEKKGGIPPGQAKKDGGATWKARKGGGDEGDKESKEAKEKKVDAEKKSDAEKVSSPEKERRGPFGIFGRRRSPEEDKAKADKAVADAKAKADKEAAEAKAKADKATVDAKGKTEEAGKVTRPERERRGPFGLFGKRRSPHDRAKAEQEAKEAKEKAEKAKQ